MIKTMFRVMIAAALIVGAVVAVRAGLNGVFERSEALLTRAENVISEGQASMAGANGLLDRVEGLFGLADGFLASLTAGLDGFAGLGASFQAFLEPFANLAGSLDGWLSTDWLAGGDMEALFDLAEDLKLDTAFGTEAQNWMSAETFAESDFGAGAESAWSMDELQMEGMTDLFAQEDFSTSLWDNQMDLSFDMGTGMELWP